jgi:RNA polymerase sigma factor (sigma-70 family)
LSSRSKIIDLFRRKAEQNDFESLIMPHFDHLFRLAGRFTGNRSDAEDLVQELLLQLYPRRTKLSEVENLRPWLTRALYYRFVESKRRHSREPLYVRDNEDEEELIDQQTSSSREVESELTMRHLIEVMDGLNSDQRALVVLHDMEGYTLTELGVLLETPVGTLKSRLHRARSYLRKRLKMEPFWDIERDS